MPAAISVSGLGKRYKLGVHRAGRYRTLREALSEGLATIGRRQDRAPRHEPADSEFWALRDVSFDIGVGERVGIIGRNGAGKSTLLKLLSRITSPTCGRIVLRGRVASLLEVGTGFHPELSGRENIYVNGSILGMRRSEIQRNFDEIVDFADIEQFLDTPVKRYSSGMYMRLAFAVAAHLDPEILLVDEVLAVGDAAFQAKCLGKMESISREGRTVLFVSHNMSAVATLCERAILLQKGTQAMAGTVDAVVSHYLASTPVADELAQRRDRVGTGSVRATSVSFIDHTGAPQRTLLSGKPIDVVVELDVKQDALGKSASVVLVVCDRAETRLFSLYSEWQRSSLVLVRERERLVCSVPAGFPLIPDHYSMIIGVLVNGVVADKVSDAVQFEVVAKDAFGTGAIPSIGLGPVIVAHSWSNA
jgi:lipopolysaccharide transport system ATP-binding protein